MDWLQRFYASMCNDEWEHSGGFFIGNIDNPGWSFSFELTDTFLEGQSYEPKMLHRSDADWVITKLEGNRWIGYGGALNLDELIGYFRQWSERELQRQGV
jgi:hypothetical protein